MITMIKVRTILDVYKWNVLRGNTDETIMQSVYNEVKRLVPHCEVELVPTKTLQQDNALITLEQSLIIKSRKTGEILWENVIWTRLPNEDPEHLHIR